MNAARSRAKTRLPFFVIILAVLSLFWPVILNPSHILYPTFSPFSDTMVIHWPKARLIAQSWQAGEGLPYWTPLILSGMPLAANQLAMLFYPPAWLFLIFPLEPTFNLLFIFHLVLGGVGIHLLLREGFRLSPWAALLGGLTFALNGKLLAHAAGGHVSMVGAFSWMVWGIFGVQMLLQQRWKGEESNNPSGTVTRMKIFTLTPSLARLSSPCGRGIEGEGLFSQELGNFHLSDLRWAMLVAVAVAMQVVTHTLPVIYSLYLIGAMVGWHLMLIYSQRGLMAIRFEIRRLALPLLLIPILAVLLGASQILSLLELAPFSNRSLTLAQAAQYSVTPAQLVVGLLLPSAQGGHELVIYLGLLPLLLIPFGLTRHNRWTWFYGGVFVFTLLFALGPSTPLHGLMYQFAPGFGWVRTPARIFFVGAIAASVLVGFAVDRLASVEWSQKIQKRLTLLAVGLGASALLVGVGLMIGFGQLNRATVAFTAVVPLALMLIVLRLKRLITPRLTVTLLGLLLFFDLASFDMSMIRFVSLEEALTPGRAAAEYLAQKPGRFRIYSPSYSLPMQTAAAHNLELADGVEPVHLAVYDQFMARAGGYNDASFSVTIPNFGAGPLDSALKDVEPNLKLLGLLNVGYLASAFPMQWPGLMLETEINGSYIYANEFALPRAWVAHQTAPAETDWLNQLERSPNLADVVLVDNGPQLTGASPPASAATVTRYSANLIEIETQIDEPGWLVFSEIWYPGWQATVDGSSQPVARVNGLLRGVYLSQAGQYRVELSYRPPTAIWGWWVSITTAALLVLIGLGFVGMRFIKASFGDPAFSIAPTTPARAAFETPNPSRNLPG